MPPKTITFQTKQIFHGATKYTSDTLNYVLYDYFLRGHSFKRRAL